MKLLKYQCSKNIISFGHHRIIFFFTVDLLDLRPLPVTALGDMQLAALYKFSHFNPVQTQIFHTLYHTDSNVLLGK